MTTAIGTVGQGEFMSSKSLVEAAKIILSARPEGLSEDMLVHILLLDDRLPLLGGGAHVYGVRKDKSKNSLGNKGLSALRRTKGMRKQDGRWIYTGPPPKAEKVAYDEAVVNLAPPPSPSTRCCKGCGAILRRTNMEEHCAPCNANPDVETPRRTRQWTKEAIIREARLDAMRRGYAPTPQEWKRAVRPGETRPGYGAVITHFRSFNAMLVESGLDSAPKRARRPPEKKLTDAQEAYRQQVLGLLPLNARELAEQLERDDHHNLLKMLRRMAADGLVCRVGARGCKGVWHRIAEATEEAA